MPLRSLRSVLRFAGSGSLLSRLAFRREYSRWKARAARAAVTDLDDLRRMRTEARTLGPYLNEVIFSGDDRLALPRIGSTAFPLPQGTEWSWRPDLWRGPLAGAGLARPQSKTTLAPGVTLFHDDPLREFSLRQVRNRFEADLAPYALRLEVYRFAGSFLSLALNLPPAAAAGLKKRHVIRMTASVELERPIEVFGRINIRHGPNTEQMVQELAMEDGGIAIADFDLAYTNLNEKRVESVWVDLIMDSPEMNMVTIRDVTFARYPRLDL